MIRLSVIIVIMILSALVQKVNAQQNIVVVLENVKSNKGKVGFALYQKEGWLEIPVKAVFSKIENGKSSCTFKGVSGGTYAISCYHDRNNNNKLDFSPQGMPLEDYGVSNNIINLYGPPIFEDAKFTINDKTVDVKIRL